MNNRKGKLTNTGTLNSTYYLTNASGAQLINKLTLNTSGTVTKDGPAGLVNDGTVENQSGAKLTNDGTLTNNSGGKLINAGTLNNELNSTLENYGTLYNNNSHGTLTVKTHAKLSNFSSLENLGLLTNDGTINLSQSDVPESLFNNHANGTLTNSGSLFINPEATLFNYGTLYNNNSHGTLTVKTNAKLSNFGILENLGLLTNDGTINLSQSDVPESLFNNHANGTLTNNSGGTLTVEAGATLTNSGNLVNKSNGTLTNNQGTLTNHNKLDNYGTLNNDGTLDITSGSTLTNAATFINEKDGTLTGDGTINCKDGAKIHNRGKISGNWTSHDCQWNDSGSLSADKSAGVLTIEGDLYKTGGSKDVELGGLVNGGGDKSLTEFDWLHVTGNVELAGLLNVSFIDGFKLGRGMSFDILAVDGQLSGQYDGLAEGDLVGNYDGQDLFITYIGGDGNDVSLYTNPIPEPATLLLTLLGLLALATTAHRTRCG